MLNVHAGKNQKCSSHVRVQAFHNILYMKNREFEERIVKNCSIHLNVAKKKKSELLCSGRVCNLYSIRTEVKKLMIYT